MDSFDALRRREEKPQNFGEFRTKRLILERYDAMAEAIRTGRPYQTILDPPPGHGPRHPARTESLSGVGAAVAEQTGAAGAACPGGPGDAQGRRWSARAARGLSTRSSAESSSRRMSWSVPPTGSRGGNPPGLPHRRRCDGRVDDQERRLGDHRGWDRGAGDVPDAGRAVCRAEPPVPRDRSATQRGSGEPQRCPAVHRHDIETGRARYVDRA